MRASLGRRPRASSLIGDQRDWPTREGSRLLSRAGRQHPGTGREIHPQATRPLGVCSTSAKELCVFLWSNWMAPVDLSMTADATSISLYSNPPGIRTVTRCSFPVAGTFSGSVTVSTKPGMDNWPRRFFLSNLKRDRKSTRLNSSHGYISYAVFCLKKKKQKVKES